jgi:hypothetical protein
VKTFLAVFTAAILLIPASVKAQPVLSIVMSNEFGPAFKGLVGGGFGTRYAMSNELNWNSTLPLRGVEGNLDYGQHKIMRFVLEIVNEGRDPWTAGNAWANPQHYRFLEWYGPCIADLVGVTISAPDGNVVRERLPELSLMWGVNPAIPGIASTHSYYNVAIDGGFAASSGWDGQEYLSDSLIDISLLTNGPYAMDVMLDPLNAYGLFRPEKNPRIWVSINDTEVSVIPAPAKATPAKAISAARPKPAWMTNSPSRPPPPLPARP